MPTLSIVIPTYNGLAHLQRCLPTVTQYAPRNSQIIVVDDASSDETVKWLPFAFPKIELISLTANGGFCQAVNAGLAQATGDVVELLNNDTTVTPGWADHCLHHFDDPSIGSVAPLVMMMHQNRIDSAGMEYHICGWARNRGYNRALTSEFLTSQEVFGPSGSSGFYRRAALQKTGFLIPDYGAYFEDTDLAFRLRWAGYKCVYEPQSIVYHAESATYGKSDRVEKLIARNEELVYWINLNQQKLLLGLPLHLGFQLVRLIRKAINGQLSPFLLGKLEAIAKRKFILERRRELLKYQSTREEVIDLNVNTNLDVISKGYRWLTLRQSA